jgi:hypothetical protein
MQQLFIAFLPLFFLLLLIGAVLRAIQRGWLKGAEVAYNETVQEDVVEQESSYSDDASDNGGEGWLGWVDAISIEIALKLECFVVNINSYKIISIMNLVVNS